MKKRRRRGEGEGGGVREEEPPKVSSMATSPMKLFQDLSEHRVGELILDALFVLISLKEGGNGLFAHGLYLLYFPYVE